MKKVGSFIKKHVKKFIGGVIGLMLTALSFGLYHVYKNKHEEEA